MTPHHNNSLPRGARPARPHLSRGGSVLCVGSPPAGWKTKPMASMVSSSHIVTSRGRSTAHRAGTSSRAESPRCSPPVDAASVVLDGRPPGDPDRALPRTSRPPAQAIPGPDHQRATPAEWALCAVRSNRLTSRRPGPTLRQTSRSTARGPARCASRPSPDRRHAPRHDPRPSHLAGPQHLTPTRRLLQKHHWSAAALLP